MLKKTFVLWITRAAPLIALLSSSANAAAGWGQSMTVQSYIPNDSGLTIQVLDNSINPMGCSMPTWLHMNIGDTNFALVSSTILTAFAQGKSVKVWQDSCQSDGGVHFYAAWVDK